MQFAPSPIVLLALHTCRESQCHHSLEYNVTRGCLLLIHTGLDVHGLTLLVASVPTSLSVPYDTLHVLLLVLLSVITSWCHFGSLAMSVVGFLLCLVRVPLAFVVRASPAFILLLFVPQQSVDRQQHVSLVDSGALLSTTENDRTIKNEKQNECTFCWKTASHTASENSAFSGTHR